MRRRTSRHHGLGMVEAMISLAIAAVLLTAVGVAFTSSARAMTINDQFFRASQAGRVSVARIMTQVRRGSVDEGSTSTNIRLITDTGIDMTYFYNSSNKELRLRPSAEPSNPGWVLARNVTKCTFNIELGTDYNNAQCVSRVTMDIAVRVGNNEVYMSGSGAPRRNVLYK